MRGFDEHARNAAAVAPRHPPAHRLRSKTAFTMPFE